MTRCHSFSCIFISVLIVVLILYAFFSFGEIQSISSYSGDSDKLRPFILPRAADDNQFPLKMVFHNFTCQEQEDDYHIFRGERGCCQIGYEDKKRTYTGYTENGKLIYDADECKKICLGQEFYKAFYNKDCVAYNMYAQKPDPDYEGELKFQGKYCNPSSLVRTESTEKGEQGETLKKELFTVDECASATQDNSQICSSGGGYFIHSGQEKDQCYCCTEYNELNPSINVKQDPKKNLYKSVVTEQIFTAIVYYYDELQKKVDKSQLFTTLEDAEAYFYLTEKTNNYRVLLNDYSLIKQSVIEGTDEKEDDIFE